MRVCLPGQESLNYTVRQERQTMKNPKEIVWVDAVTKDAKHTATFYEKVLGLKADQVDEGEDTYSYSLQAGDKDVLGICTADKFKRWVTGWVLYFDVEDYDLSIAEIACNGGEIFHEFETTKPGEARSCLLKDPSGNSIMITESINPKA